MSGFISGIHNYCDRWCERCTFTARCRVAEAETETTEAERDINNEAFWRKISANFAEAAQMLKEMAEERGIDLNAVSDEEFAIRRKREKEIVKSKDLTKLAEQYWKNVRKTLETKDDWLIFSAPGEDENNEMIAVIAWYQFFISAKLQRGLQVILNFDGKLDEEQLNDSQSDANGSVKIALIAVERSMMAWANLSTAENFHVTAPFISLLETIKQTAEKEFPNAKDFVRPGFDEIETVM